MRESQSPPHLQPAGDHPETTPGHSGPADDNVAQGEVAQQDDVDTALEDHDNLQIDVSATVFSPTKPL